MSFTGLVGNVSRMSWPKASCPSLLLYYPCLEASHFSSDLFYRLGHESMSTFKELMIALPCLLLCVLFVIYCF